MCEKRETTNLAKKILKGWKIWRGEARHTSQRITQLTAVQEISDCYSKQQASKKKKNLNLGPTESVREALKISAKF